MKSEVVAFIKQFTINKSSERVCSTTVNSTLASGYPTSSNLKYNTLNTETRAISLHNSIELPFSTLDSRLTSSSTLLPPQPAMRLIRGMAALASTVAVAIRMVVQRLWRRVICTIVPTTAVRKPVEQLVSWRCAVVSMSTGLGLPASRLWCFSS